MYSGIKMGVCLLVGDEEVGSGCCDWVRSQGLSGSSLARPGCPMVDCRECPLGWVLPWGDLRCLISSGGDTQWHSLLALHKAVEIGTLAVIARVARLFPIGPPLVGSSV